MITRDEVYQMFGPFLSEAIVLLMLEQINTLRQEQGMPEVTYQSFLDKVMNHHSSLEKYDWQDDET